MSRLFVYGTLRREGAGEAVLHGFRKRTDAPYPTIEPAEGGSVRGQVIEVGDWETKDRYEGRVRGDPNGSLYWRLQITDDVQVYVGNPVHAQAVWGQSWDAGYGREEMKWALGAADLEVLS